MIIKQFATNYIFKGILFLLETNVYVINTNF